MYCVRCGVKLQNGENKCPLCNTRVINPDDNESVKKVNIYSDVLPKKQRMSNMPLAIILTVFLAIAVAIILLVCNRVYGELRWGGIASLGILLAYIIAVFPLWFTKPNPVIFVPVDHAAIALYLGYICLSTDGNWFLSFAFPVVMILGAIMTAAVTLFRYLKNGRYFILGGFFVLLAIYSSLIEMFEHFTFGTQMFLWSVYPLTALLGIGVFFLLAGIIRPLREYLERKFFI